MRAKKTMVMATSILIVALFIGTSMSPVFAKPVETIETTSDVERVSTGLIISAPDTPMGTGGDGTLVGTSSSNSAGPLVNPLTPAPTGTPPPSGTPGSSSPIVSNNNPGNPMPTGGVGGYDSTWDTVYRLDPADPDPGGDPSDEPLIWLQDSSGPIGDSAVTSTKLFCNQDESILEGIACVVKAVPVVTSGSGTVRFKSGDIVDKAVLLYGTTVLSAVEQKVINKIQRTVLSFVVNGGTSVVKLVLKIKNAVNSLKTALFSGVTFAAAKGYLDEILQMFGIALGNLVNIAINVITNLIDVLLSNADLIIDALSSLIAFIGTGLQNIAEKISDIINFIIDNQVFEKIWNLIRTTFAGMIVLFENLAPPNEYLLTSAGTLPVPLHRLQVTGNVNFRIDLYSGKYCNTLIESYSGEGSGGSSGGYYTPDECELAEESNGLILTTGGGLLH